MDTHKERPNLNEHGKGLNWIPFAKIHPNKMTTHGKYAKGYPQGAIVHYTAGVQAKGSGSLDYGREQGYCFLLIDSEGVIHQAHPLNQWGYHAGKSSYAGLPGTVSNELIGIEIACAGLLTKIGNKYKAWFHKKESEYFDESQVRYSKGHDNIQEGYYQKYTEAQEESLIHLLQWLKSNDPVGCFSYDMVLGHDSVCVPKGRKSDPGASLSMSIPELQRHLKSL